MNVVKKYIKNWFGSEINDCLFWEEYQGLILDYIDTNDSSKRVMMYKIHLKLLNSKWSGPYAHSLECAYIRELASKNRNFSFFSELIQKLKEKKEEKSLKKRKIS